MCATIKSQELATAASAPQPRTTRDMHLQRKIINGERKYLVLASKAKKTSQTFAELLDPAFAGVKVSGNSTGEAIAALQEHVHKELLLENTNSPLSPHYSHQTPLDIHDAAVAKTCVKRLEERHNYSYYLSEITVGIDPELFNMDGCPNFSLTPVLRVAERPLYHDGHPYADSVFNKCRLGDIEICLGQS